MGKGGTKQETTQHTVSDPWSQAQPYLSEALARGGQLFQGGGFAPYTGQSQATVDARAAAENLARQGSDVARTGLGMWGAAADPYAGMQAVRDQALRGALVPTASMFENSGMLNTNLAAQGVAEAAARGLAPIEYGAYNQAMDRGLKASAMAPAMLGLEQTNIDRLAQAGAAEDARQRMLHGAPLEEISRYSQFAQGMGGMGGTTTGGGSTGEKKGAMDSIGGIMQTIGPLIGAAAMFASDERIKTDIKKVGKTDDGLNVYTYRYKHWPDDAPSIMGVMAQELEKKKPHAVGEDAAGTKYVNYAEVT